MRMNKTLIALVVLLFCLSPAFGDEVIELSYGSSLGPNHTFSLADKDWIAYVESRSGGRLKIRPYWSATLISGDNSVAELRHGVVDIAMITPIYMRAGMHAIRAQTGFYVGGSDISTQVEVFHCLLRGFPIFQQELDGVRVLAVQGGTPSYVLTRDRPIQTLQDISGLRLRSPTALVPVVYELGADPILLPMGDVYSAFAKGIIDGVLTPEDTLRSLHFAEIARYLNRLTMHRGGYPSRAIADRVWEKLPVDLQLLLRESGVYWEERLAHYILLGNQAAIDYGRAKGVEFLDVNDSVQTEFDQLYTSIAKRDAESLKRYGIDGVAIFDYVVATIEDIAAGRHKSCREVNK